VRFLGAIIAAVAVLGACGGGDADVKTRSPAERVVQNYLDAAARRDGQALCALRTEAAVRTLGGRSICEHELETLVADRGPTPRAVDPKRTRILSADTSADGDRARVVADFGKAKVEDEHATGGTVIEFDLQGDGDEYKVARVGFAAFAD
jgi:hypothetical protein